MLNESIEDLQRRTDSGIATGGDVVQQLQRVTANAGQHAATIASQHRHGMQTTAEALLRLQAEFAQAGWPNLAKLGQAYLVDAWQRGVLTADILRERGNIFEAHEAAGAPPVLCYEYDVIVDGHDLKRPVNYMLLRIHPPEGVEVHDWKRPYMIIDPRAGHGAGIGGFKPDSQVASRYTPAIRCISSPFGSIPNPARRLPT